MKVLPAEIQLLNGALKYSFFPYLTMPSFSNYHHFDKYITVSGGALFYWLIYVHTSPLEERDLPEKFGGMFLAFPAGNGYSNFEASFPFWSPHFQRRERAF